MIRKGNKVAVEGMARGTPPEPAGRAEEGMAREVMEAMPEIMDGLRSYANPLPRQAGLVSERLTFHQFKIMLRFLRQPMHTVTGLAGRLGVTLPTMTHLVDRMAALKLLRRDRSHRDRRVVEVSLTPQGARVLAAFKRNRVQAVTALLERMSADDRHDLVRSVSHLLTLLRRYA